MKKYEKICVEDILEKLFYVENEIGDVVKEAPFPWDDEECKKLKKEDEEFFWNSNKDIDNVFRLNSYRDECSCEINLKLFFSYMKKNESKFEVWFSQYQKVWMYAENDIVYVVGRREETDEEFAKRVKEIEDKKLEAEQKKLSRIKKREEKQRSLYEQLKKEFGENK